SSTVREVCLLVGSVVAGYPIMGEYPKPTFRILQSPVFENGLEQVWQRRVSDVRRLVAMVLPTSKTCERLFSECNRVLAPHHCGLLPVTEILAFQCTKKAIWDVTTLV
ncbi:hypothetical protein PHYSODRAFT_533783, partial [Phytophthora sojae]